MGFLSKIWSEWLVYPLEPLKEWTGIDWTQNPYLIVYRIVILFVLFLALFEIYIRSKRRLRKLFEKDDFLESDEIGLKKPADKAFIETIEAARNLDGTIATLKKEKQYERMGQVYASVNKPKDAAKWFQKAGNRRRAAEEWARAGYTTKAAKMLMKEGDYATAARFFESDGRLALAAAAYLKASDIPKAAESYGKAGKVPDALRVFTGYFELSNDPPEVQLAAADACFALMESEAGRAKATPEERAVLLPVLAARFEQARRLDLAGRLYYEGGHPEQAGSVLLRMGKLEEAARCYREAGNTREASLIGARYNEQRQQWTEAGNAYAQAGEFLRAGDCFAKANDAARTAECYQRAGEYYGAALALSHLKKYEEAVRLLQKIHETDKKFNESRALLGRCFYELHDYEHCAAALENHLTGKRVESSNVDYFYMLALACEQLGDLGKSRDILYKIHTLDVGFKDVTQRISNISSRISMGAGERVVTPNMAAMPTQRAPVMEAVENILGTRYRLERELGRGGMGTVYLARDTQLDRLVALKFLGALVDGSEEYRQRFVREAKAAARVNHPNIVHIYDISAREGQAYIAMEYVDGVNLNTYAKKRGALLPREAVSIMTQACSALDAIHKAGIIHRDIKPDNILIAKGGLVKLADFGLAKAEGARMTETGVIMGTPAYMSPEQTLNSDVGPASDIYSLGLVFYEIITGTVVFRGGDLLSRQKTETPPAPRTISEAVPEQIDRMIMKCIEKVPAKRYQTAEALLEALREVKS